ncbi:hypothetical protein ACQJBY_061866 [Aegilops geniculata]
MELEIVEEEEEKADESRDVHKRVFSDASSPTRDVSTQGRGIGNVRETRVAISTSLGAMRALVGKLDMLLLAPQGCSRRVKDRMRLLKDDVEHINSYLDVLSQLEDPPLTAKCWMNEACDLSYDMEDYINSLIFVQPEDPSLVPNNIKTTRSLCKWFSHVKTLERCKRKEQIVETLSEFRMYVQEAIERHQRYNLRSCSTLRCRFVSLGPMPLPTPYKETDGIVIDGRMKEFINSLANDEDKQLKVVSVLGPACLGKTTLARVLYDKLGKRYHCRAFIWVSKRPDMKRIFHDMLLQLQWQDEDPPEYHNEIDLIDNIKIYLRNKRYLIVIDDVWAASVWDIINDAFPKGNHGSRIITTTQIEDVALTCCCYQSEYVFEMKHLDDDHSRKLFFNRIFGSESDCPEKFKEILNKIVDICGGLPLATVSIASLLASQPAMTDDLLEHIHESLSSCFSASERTRQALNLSFNNLPHYLKTCLLYLIMYQEGWTFCKDGLVRLWIAEGFIDTTEGQDIVKVAESYFDQLIGRRFIQPICSNFNNEVLSCAVHDTVYDLIAHKSAEENFIVAIDYSRKNVSLSHKVCRLSLLFGDARCANTPENIRKSQVWSLKFFGLFECMPCLGELKLLRVLNLQIPDHGGNDDPVIDLTAISQCFQLRYLSVASDGCIILPNHGLQCLETLHIMDARVACVPCDIHVTHLLHLSLPIERNLLDWCVSMGGLGKLNYLEDLYLTVPSRPSYVEERSMEALGSLIGGHDNLKSVQVVAHRSSVRNALVRGASKVTISWDDLAPPPFLQRFEYSLRSCIIFYSIPKWVGKLDSLCILKISVRELMMSCVDILRGLTSLTALSLYVQRAPIEGVIFGKAGFLVLKYFKLRCMSGISWLKFEADAMPNLWKLKLVFNSIPRMDQQHRCGTALIIIEHMPDLKEISVKFGGAAADVEYAWRTFVSNHPSNPIIDMQSVDYSSYCDESTKRKQRSDEILEEKTDDMTRHWIDQRIKVFQGHPSQKKKKNRFQDHQCPLRFCIFQRWGACLSCMEKSKRSIPPSSQPPCSSSARCQQSERSSPTRISTP